MDKLIEGLVGSVIGIAILLVFGAVIGVGWLLYKFCQLVLPPILEELGKGCAALGRAIRDWWREVILERDLQRIERDAVQQIDTIREEHVERFRQFVAAIEEQERLTAEETAAVESAVRTAVSSEVANE